MFVLLLAAADVASPPAAKVCAAADPAVTSFTSELLKKRGGVDHYVLTMTITNVGGQSQTPDITQRVELLRDGVVLAPQSLPALAAGAAYTLAFAVDRPAADRSRPLTVTVRYELTSGDPARNACDRSNDALTKSF
jgi:hypothetical protein